MPSYTQYKRFMACLDEDDPDIVGWFTTENGLLKLYCLRRNKPSDLCLWNKVVVCLSILL